MRCFCMQNIRKLKNPTNNGCRKDVQVVENHSKCMECDLVLHPFDKQNCLI